MNAKQLIEQAYKKQYAKTKAESLYSPNAVASALLEVKAIYNANNAANEVRRKHNIPVLTDTELD